MPGLFEALSKIPKREPKKFFVTIQGKQYQVSHKKKLEIMQHGEENYMIKPAKFGPEILLKPKEKIKTRYSVLKKAERGYVFEEGDIHWPNGVQEGGVLWQIESE